MSGKGVNRSHGDILRLADNSVVPQRTFTQKVLPSNNREQHQGRHVPSINTSVKVSLADGGLRAVPAMLQNPRQAYSQAAVTSGQRTPKGRTGIIGSKKD